MKDQLTLLDMTRDGDTCKQHEDSIRRSCYDNPTSGTTVTMVLNLLKNSSSLLLLISSSQRSFTLLAHFVSFPKIACLHVSFTAFEYFSKIYKTHCLLVLFSTFFPSEVSEIRNSTIKHISTYTMVHSSISTYVVDRFLLIFCP